MRKMKALQVEQLVPTVTAMILADVVHRDSVSRKFSILGTFTTINTPAFPYIHPRLVVYLALTDGRGTTPMKMRLIDVDDTLVVFESDMVMSFDTDPTLVSELRFVANHVVFPSPGEYRLQLFAAGTLLREQRIYARQNK